MCLFHLFIYCLLHFTYCWHHVVYVLLTVGILSFSLTGLRRPAGNVSGYRGVSECRSRGHEFEPGLVVEIYHEIISAVTLVPSAKSSKRGCCQLHAKICAQSTEHKVLVNRLFKPAQEKVRLCELTVPPWPLLLTWGVKQNNKQTETNSFDVLLFCFSPLWTYCRFNFD